jgi:3-oxoacyl-[acyl-carrier-protein] synthase III
MGGVTRSTCVKILIELICNTVFLNSHEESEKRHKKNMMRSVIKGVGASTPKRIITNHELEQTLETSDEWIRERTGIAQRHIAAEGEMTSHLGARAAQEALLQSGISADEIDLIVLATATPDETFPATATRIQHQLGITNAAAFDVNAACSGFVYALHITDALLRSGQHRHALVIGAETMSRVVDWNDRHTAILFGDGAGACVLSAEEETEHGILSSMIASRGSYGDLLHTDGGVSLNQRAGVLHMEGKEVFRHAVEKMSAAVMEAAQRAGVTLDDITYLVPHQANARILSACAKKLGMDESRVIMSVDEYANTSSASIPLALAKATKKDIIKRGDLVMLTALGAGFTWGSCLIRW